MDVITYQNNIKEEPKIGIYLYSCCMNESLS